MSRQNPIPPREVEICQRVRLARLSTNLSQVVFARLAGIDSSRLASYEHARVPIRAGLALAVAKISGVSLRWLADGMEPKKLPFYVDKKLRDRIQERQLFSEVYDNVLMPLIERQIAEIKTNSGGKLDVEAVGVIGDVGPGDFLNLINPQLSKIAWETPPHLLQELYTVIYWDLWNFRHNYADPIEKFSGASGAFKSSKDKIEYEGLTNEADSLTSGVVQPVLPKLIQRLERATKVRGRKKELADWLGVHRQMVTDWLSGKQEPGGETTLRLLHWVEQQERQK